jgi:hypothetical protein
MNQGVGNAYHKRADILQSAYVMDVVVEGGKGARDAGSCDNFRISAPLVSRVDFSVGRRIRQSPLRHGAAPPPIEMIYESDLLILGITERVVQGRLLQTV